jgi:hypothetical protein
MKSRPRVTRPKNDRLSNPVGRLWYSFVAGFARESTQAILAAPLRPDNVAEDLAAAKPATVFAPPVIVCNRKHRFLVAEHLRSCDVHLARIILEPVGHNSARAITAAAMLLAEEDPDTIVCMFSAVGDARALHVALQAATAAACTSAQGDRNRRNPASESRDRLWIY